MLKDSQWAFLGGNLSMAVVAAMYGGSITAADIVATTIFTAVFLIAIAAIHGETKAGG